MEQTGKDKLEQLAKLKSQVRIGGKVRLAPGLPSLGGGVCLAVSSSHSSPASCFRPQGKPRRKKKVVSRSSGADDKKLQSTLKKLGANPIPGVEEVCAH